MNTLRNLLILLALIFIIGESGFGQPSGPQRRHPEMGSERLGKYKKMRLIEALDLKEEEAVRFMAKFNTHENNLHDLMKNRKDIIDQLESILRSKGTDKEFQKLFAQLEENDQKMFNERQRFHNEVKGALTAEQAAKFLVFDRNFNRELRGAMDDMRRERRERNMR